jgi:hypothetical protein
VQWGALRRDLSAQASSGKTWKRGSGSRPPSCRRCSWAQSCVARHRTGAAGTIAAPVAATPVSIGLVSIGLVSASLVAVVGKSAAGWSGRWRRCLVRR